MVKMKVTLEDYNNRTEEMEATSAAIHYSSKPKNLDLIKAMKGRKHLATFRSAYAVIKIECISTIGTIQLLRTNLADMIYSDNHLLKSQRYVNQSERDFVVPQCEYIDATDVRGLAVDMFEDINRVSKEYYNSLIRLGVKKEDARFALTRAVTTDLYIAGNMQMWSQFLKLRTDKHAQWEIRAIANEIALVLSEKFPRIMEEFIQR